MRFGVRSIFCISFLFFHSGKEDFAFRADLLVSGSSKERVAHAPVRIAMSRMREELGKPAPLHLSRLFLSTRSQLRLRCSPLASYARANRAGPSQHVALLQPAALTAQFSALPSHRIHAALSRPTSSRAARSEESLHQERCRLPANFEL